MAERESLRVVPDGTQVAIVKQGMARPRRKIDQAQELLKIRAFQDAARVLREAAEDLSGFAARLDSSE